MGHSQLFPEKAIEAPDRAAAKEVSMVEQGARTSDAIMFGPFTVLASERLLKKDGDSIELGARAFDILVALLSCPGQPVSKKDLMARVWPDVVVEEGSLRFHVAALRKALGDGQNGARYITTLAGRGYCFVAPVSWRNVAAAAAQAPDPVDVRHANLPIRLSRMVGRAENVLAVSELPAAERFVTITGAGGVGKTTVAVALSRSLMTAFDGAVLLIDLGALMARDLTSASGDADVGVRFAAAAAPDFPAMSLS